MRISLEDELGRVEKQLIEHALQTVVCVKSKTAKLLGTTRSVIHYKMQKSITLILAAKIVLQVNSVMGRGLTQINTDKITNGHHCPVRKLRNTGIRKNEKKNTVLRRYFS